MGYELRRMIRDGAPRSWTSLMRDVAKEIADDARDPGDDSPLPEGRWPWSALRVEGYRDRHGRWHDGLTEICGVSARAISDALTELGRAGYEMRQPIRGADGKPVTDKRGRLVFAAKGHALAFHVPPLPPRGEPQSSQESATFSADSSHESAGNDAAPDAPAALEEAESPHRSAGCDPQRSHPAVSKAAPECDPVPSLSPQKIQSPQTVVSVVTTSVEGAWPMSREDETEDFESRRQRYMNELMTLAREQAEAS